MKKTIVAKYNILLQFLKYDFPYEATFLNSKDITGKISVMLIFT